MTAATNHLSDEVKDILGNPEAHTEAESEEKSIDC
jgi:hypothetical protein